ncbi:hypothetical protein FA15DRAFT_657032 [Coprinopsis marcescibilis]|uniref:Uncharacterized protein n=1 Tax=Coprinopsis marcescibilis TaxID=230819 RepID=A0A5C3KRA5_COPMA|nr:hypothetical protein FA15DRAFT_657032 [Coprinopsis marcescibilis]
MSFSNAVSADVNIDLDSGAFLDLNAADIKKRFKAVNGPTEPTDYGGILYYNSPSDLAGVQVGGTSSDDETRIVIIFVDVNGRITAKRATAPPTLSPITRTIKAPGRIYNADAHHSANSWAVGAQWACRQSELDIRDKCKIEDASRDKSARFSGSHSTNAITDFEFRPPAFGKRDNLPNWAPGSDTISFQKNYINLSAVVDRLLL